MVKKRRWIRGEKIGPAFWTIASLFSMLVNIVLIAVLLSIGQQLFTLKKVVEQDVLGGLYENFLLMDEAHIRTTIPVATEVPAKFDLPLKTNTTVTLVEDTLLTNATIYDLNAGGVLTINRASTNIILPAGTRLPITLDLMVPVDQTIPVQLNVDVDIPLNQTELHRPFVGLREVVDPYYTYLHLMPDSWQDVLCGPDASEICTQLIR
ncbi:hypothetical protein GX408_07555 [bacterium]|nr:hypothetical protein [bacterium]